MQSNVNFQTSYSVKSRNVVLNFQIGDFCNCPVASIFENFFSTTQQEVYLKQELYGVGFIDRLARDLIERIV